MRSELYPLRHGGWPVPCQNSFTSAELVLLRSLGRSAVFADQAADGLPALNLGGDIDGVAGFAQRRSLASVFHRD